MNPNIQDLHNQAMLAAEKADAAKRSGNTVEQKKLLAVAYTLENQAATTAEEQQIPEPSRSILRNSANALKEQCNE